MSAHGTLYSTGTSILIFISTLEPTGSEPAFISINARYCVIEVVVEEVVVEDVVVVVVIVVVVVDPVGDTVGEVVGARVWCEQLPG